MLTLIKLKPLTLSVFVVLGKDEAVVYPRYLAAPSFPIVAVLNCESPTHIMPRQAERRIWLSRYTRAFTKRALFNCPLLRSRPRADLQLC